MAKSTTQYVVFEDGEAYIHDASLFRSDIAAGRAKVLSGAEGEAAYKQAQRNELLALGVRPGKTVLTVVCTHYNSNSGTGRYKVFLPRIHKGEAYIANVTRTVAALCGFKRSKDGDEIVMGGYGYSKPFQIGYDLGRSMWPNGTPEPHSLRNGEPDCDGGYALSVRDY